MKNGVTKIIAFLAYAVKADCNPVGGAEGYYRRGKPVPFQCYGKRSEIGVEYACGGIFCPCSLAQGQHCDQGDYNATHKAFFNSDM